MPSSYLAPCSLLFLLVAQPLQAQYCQILDSSFCFIHKENISGPIQLELKSASSIGNIHSTSFLTYADITGDCYPEVLVTAGGEGPRILVVNPITGDTIFSLPTVGFSSFSKIVSIADVDNDQNTELFFNITWSESNLDPGRYVCMNVEGTTRWISDDYHDDKKSELSTESI